MSTFPACNSHGFFLRWNELGWAMWPLAGQSGKGRLQTAQMNPLSWIPSIFHPHGVLLSWLFHRHLSFSILFSITGSGVKEWKGNTEGKEMRVEMIMTRNFHSCLNNPWRVRYSFSVFKILKLICFHRTLADIGESDNDQKGLSSCRSVSESCISLLCSDTKQVVKKNLPQLCLKSWTAKFEKTVTNLPVLVRMIHLYMQSTHKKSSELASSVYAVCCICSLFPSRKN